MKKFFVFIVIVLCMGCSSGDGAPDEEPSNSILIQSISPTRAENGIETEFTVTVDYELVDMEQGEISIGFNPEEENKFAIIYGEEISLGTGTLEVVVSATPKEYAPNGNFSAYAALTEYPRNDTTIIASDILDIVVIPPIDRGTFSVQNSIESNIICYIDYVEQCIQYSRWD